MPLVNHARQEIHLKVVYYGPGLGGKTTNLEVIHARTRPELRGKLISLATESERTLFFDLLPVELGLFKGYQVRLHLCTVPGQIAHDRTRRLILRHVDGIVFVVDSQASRVDDNLESIRNLADNLRLQGDDPDRLPMVVQYNKRDLPSALPVEALQARLGVPAHTPRFDAVAVSGAGVFETVKGILKASLAIVGDPRRSPEGRSPSILPGKRASMFPSAAGLRPEARALTGEAPLPPPAQAPRLDEED
ncbi:MAG: gliding-motility protein MglA [Sandaracinaceae bacterium]|nr:gliding-motility protein MglA [Sandaracinaceae bacterium]